MLRSAGYFRSIACPFGARECRRPHCQYRHELGSPEEPPRSGLGKNIHEIERLNQAIHTVKTEVEEGQKKLLHYNLVQDDFRSTLPPATSDLKRNLCSSDEDGFCSTATKDKGHVSSISKDSNKSSKYILDRSCPATDLEYDPLLNYSANLLRSSLKEDENCTQHTEHVEMFPCGNLQGSVIKAPCEKRSRSSSPIKLEIKLQESDDDILIIDVPPMNVCKKQRISRYKKWNVEQNEICSANNADVLQTSEISKSLNCIEEKRSEDIVFAVDDDQSNENKTEIKCSRNENLYLLDAKVNAESIPDLRKPYSFTKESVASSNSKMKDEMKNDFFKEDSVKAASVKTCIVEGQMSKHKTLLNSKNQTNMCSEDYSEDGAALLQDISKKLPESLGKFQNTQLCEKNEKINTAKSCPQSDLNECSPVAAPFPETTGKKYTNKTLHTSTKENEVITVDTSEESDFEEDTELSDDTMEECRKIFNEFVEREAQKEEMAKQALAAQTDVDSDSKMNVLPGPKRRIAHTAKFDVNTTKEIIVPFRAPLQQQMCHSRILQAQQQAVQITAAIKSGQAFVTATCGPKKNTPIMPAPQIQSIESMVCLNVIEVHPVATNNGQVNILLPGKALTAVPDRLSSNSVKRIAPMPIKVSTRRRPSIVPELGSKVPHDIRQRYVNFFVEEFLKVSMTENEAFDKALMEEKAIYDRCGGKNMYLNIVANTLKKLRNHGNVSSDGRLSGNRSNPSTGFRKQEEKHDFTGLALYRLLKGYVLTEEQLKENGYPQPNPEKPGSVVLCSGSMKPAVSDPFRRVCCRCGEIYAVTSSGRHARKEECNYHSGRVLRHKVPGGLETRYSCCEGVVGSPGCQVAKLHVHDSKKENIDGFVKTFMKPPPLDGNHGVFAVDCEMCYTTHGLELSKVTVVDSSLQVIYDTFVKPDNEIIDYNTRFSGVTAEDVKNTAISIRDVQAILLNLFSADSILIGHSLETDLFALKLFHNNVVDTSVVFPHRLGLPHKRALRNLIADYLRRIIQDDVGGHDSREDAAACMQLMLWKVKEDTKGRR